MTAATTKSTQVTNADAKPVTASDTKMGGNLRVWMETKELATTEIDDVGDIVRMIRIPTNCKPTSLRIYADDLDSNGTPTLAYDVGVYRSNDGAAVDVDCFATATTVGQSAVTTSPSESLVEAMDIAKIGKYAWEIAGETSDPGGFYDVAITITTAAATGAAGTFTVVMTGASVNG